MQIKTNLLEVRDGTELKTYADVDTIQDGTGVFIFAEETIGTDNEGEPIVQKQLIFYAWSKVEKMLWHESTLIDAVRQNILMDMEEDLADALGLYDDEEDEEVFDTPPSKDDPTKNPYEKDEKKDE
tara:strand:- start:68 stop:445 length:378 start_codon:yes stop_codon:yes gene_type:complete